MAKRDGSTITLGSGKLYMSVFNGTMPSVDTLCADANLLGYIKGGASLEYTQDSYEEKDDLGYVSKVITTNEAAVLKCGILTWNGNTLKKLLDRCAVTETAGTAGDPGTPGSRTTKIGGAGNAQGKNYAIAFKHEDEIDGDVVVLIKGLNTAGVSITFANDSGTVINPEFKALPHDTNGTLIELIEEMPVPVSTSST